MIDLLTYSSQTTIRRRTLITTYQLSHDVVGPNVVFNLSVPAVCYLGPATANSRYVVKDRCDLRLCYHIVIGRSLVPLSVLHGTYS